MSLYRIGPKSVWFKLSIQRLGNLLQATSEPRWAPGRGMFFVDCEYFRDEDCCPALTCGFVCCWSEARAHLRTGSHLCHSSHLEAQTCRPRGYIGLEFLLEEGNATSLPGDRAQQSVILVRINLGPGLCAHVLVILLWWERLPSFLPGQVGSASWLTKESAGLLFISHGR